MENINFTPKDILQKEFKQKMRGYDSTDVDSFLDDIIKDYESFQKNISEKDQQIDQLNSENRQLKSKIIELNNRLFEMPRTMIDPETSVDTRVTRQDKPVQENQESNVSNMDILKRLSNLERKVFGENLNN
ncbi:cell division regulator GpsB [Fructilactobacillus sanfranciscensis]|uniref:cell division regulator GpsB n=1 Tax=Fructilactobacillus sanfranciscensis TaxID=1625 RepID=UPI00111B93EF|nr:cell division regulator GpsB [Fructilactobacillus sanfranciscensis]TNK98975.1 cell division regulator GpsB [Fructilactobacillus sanfranciscensis]